MIEFFSNYFAQKIQRVEHLKHFPYDSFVDFQEAVQQQKTKTSVRMDIARQWLMSTDSPGNIALWMKLLSFVPFLCSAFYFVLAFTLHDYWLILYSLFPIFMFFTANPLAKKSGSYLIIGVLVVAFWFIRGVGFIPPFLYWIPLLLTYIVMRQMYEGAADTAEKIIMKNEKALCFFWQWSGVLIQKGDTIYAQKHYEKDSQMHYYQDIKTEWEKYTEHLRANSHLFGGRDVSQQLPIK